jgi:hypothetical protein
MHSNLTAADVAKYWGVKLVTKEGTTGTIVGVFSPHQSCNIELQDGSISLVHLISDCHLLLKPLSELSEDDAVEVAKIAAPEIRDIYYLLKIGKSILADIFENFATSSLLAINEIKDIIDYLRKNGYDMDNYLTTNKAKNA